MRVRLRSFAPAMGWTRKMVWVGRCRKNGRGEFFAARTAPSQQFGHSLPSGPTPAQGPAGLGSRRLGAFFAAPRWGCVLRHVMRQAKPSNEFLLCVLHCATRKNAALILLRVLLRIAACGLRFPKMQPPGQPHVVFCFCLCGVHCAVLLQKRSPMYLFFVVRGAMFAFVAKMQPTVLVVLAFSFCVHTLLCVFVFKLFVCVPVHPARLPAR